MRTRRFVVVCMAVITAVVLSTTLVGVGPARAESWEQTGSGGLSPGYNPLQGSASSMCVFNSKLYVGTSNQGSPGEVWCYDGGDWSLVNTPGFGTDNYSISSMAVLGGYLYAGTSSGGGCQVWRTSGGGSAPYAWTRVSSPANVGKSTNLGATSMAVSGGSLYVGTLNYSGLEVWRYNGTTWSLCVGPGAPLGPGFGNVLNVMAGCMTVSGTGTVYTGTYNNNTGCEVWGGTGVGWAQTGQAGLGDADNILAASITFFGGALYVGTDNSTDGCSVMRYDGPNPWNWTATNAAGWGTNENYSASSMATFGSPARLYVSVDNYSNGCRIMRYDGGWTQANTDGFADPTCRVVDVMMVYGTRLYAATFSMGCKVFSTSNTGAPFTWTLDNTPGFTTNDNGGITASAFYRGSPYVGTDNKRGCRVYRYDTGAWTQVGSDGLGDIHNTFVSSMVATDTTLYLGTDNFNSGGEVWRYDGTSWTQINVGGFSDAESSISALVVFNNQLYAGTQSYPNLAKVYRYNGSGTSWTLVSAPGFGTAVHVGVNSFAVLNSKLYAGTFSSNDPCNVYRYNGPGSWTKMSPDGFGSANNVDVHSMAVYNGRMYAGLYNNTLHGCEIWRFDGPAAADWSKVNSNGFGDADNYTPESMDVFSGYLYVGTSNYSTGGEVWRYNGASWLQVNDDGMGKEDNAEIGVLATDGSCLVAGVSNFATGCEVWSTGGPGNIWYLAEGTTAWGFDCYVTIQNPNGSTVQARVTYMTPTGEVSGPTVTLPPRSQATLHPGDTLGSQDFSTKVTCQEQKTLAVDRTMTWVGGAGADVGSEAHNSVGVTAPARTWYLPEGSSNWGFETWLLVQNPGSVAANVTLTYMIEGAAPVVKDKAVPAYSRASFSMADDIGAADASVKVTSDVPVIPERAMYRNSRREGHASIGTISPATDYYLAEGATGYGSGFITYVLVQNPQATQNDVVMTFMTGSGQVEGPSFTMEANSRRTVRVNDYLPGDTDVSTRVNGSAPLIAERAMYWNTGSGEACHDSIGISSPFTVFYLPDGEASSEVETWTLVQNPNGADVSVEITYMTPDGTGNVSRTETVPANSRSTFNMAQHALISGRAAIVVRSKTAGRPIMCERAMYWDNRGAGTDTIGGYED